MKTKLLLLTALAPLFIIGQNFTKITTSQVGQVSNDTRNVLVTDLDNNSRPDIHFVNRPFDSHELYLNFRDTLLAVPSGNTLASITKVTGGAIAGDIDGDCLPDIYLAHGDGGNGAISLANELFQNNGGGNFTLIPNQANNDARTSSSAAMVDFDGDGDLDIYVSNTGNTTNELYRNTGNSNFIKVDSLTIATQNMNTRVPAWCDYDNDGDLDLFLPEVSGNNHLFRNDDTAFHKITTGNIVTDGGNSFSASWGDYDGDGWMDLFVSNMSNSSPSPQNFLYNNQGNGTFQKVTTGPVSTVRGKTSSSLWFDMDNDGDLDLIATGSHSIMNNLRKNKLYRNNGNGTFTEITSGSLVTDLSFTTGVAGGDIDKDGDIDLVLGTRNGQNEIYLNDTDTLNNFISLNILGKNGLATALNAKVKLKCNFNGTTRWEYRRVIPGAGTNQVSSPITHFGLGSATVVDSIVIEWLSGQTCVFTNVAANKFYNVDPAGCRMDTILETIFEDTVSYYQAQFTDHSGGDITGWHWDFGDGDTSNLQSPTHNYTSAGKYKVCLITYDSYCKWDSVCSYVDICPDTASIGFQTHAAGKAISFFDTSSANGYQYNWTFGDGSSGSGITPVHNYSNDGTYYVCLAVTDSCRTKVYCDSIIVCNDTLVAAFGTSISVMTASFTDSSANADNILWDFGDGDTSTASNPTHTYSAPGYYVVCQTVQDYCNTTTFCDTIGICVDTAQAAFGFNNTGLLFNFTNTSANANTYSWDFGDGNFSTQENPTHVYAGHGVYTVCLAITNDCFSDTMCQNVAACNLNAIAAFSYQATATPMVMQFNDQSQDASSYLWDFGDGSSSTNQNPLKAYSTKAIYKVCLTITDSCGSQDSTCDNLNLINFDVEENSWFGQMSVYPNPTQGLVTLQSAVLNGFKLKLQLQDITGRKLLEKEVIAENGTIVLDLSQQPKGFYLLNLTDGIKSKTIKLSRN